MTVPQGSEKAVWTNRASSVDSEGSLNFRLSSLEGKMAEMKVEMRGTTRQNSDDMGDPITMLEVGDAVMSSYRISADGPEKYSKDMLKGEIKAVIQEVNGDIYYDVEFGANGKESGQCGDMEQGVPAEFVTLRHPRGFWHYQTPVAQWYSDENVQFTIAMMIALNFISTCASKQYGINHWPDDPDHCEGCGLRATFEPAKFELIEVIFTLIFSVELLINMYGFWFWEFWGGGWNVFDFVVVTTSLIQITSKGGGMAALRLFRAFRVFRLFRRVPALRQIIVAVEKAISGVGGAFILLILTISIFSIMSVEFFGDIGDVNMGSDEIPDFVEVTAFLGTFKDSFFTLFQVMTGDGWSDIARAVMVTHGGAGPFFIIYVLLTTFLLVNIAIAILLENMVEAKKDIELEDGDTFYAYVKVESAKNVPQMDVATKLADPFVEVRFKYHDQVHGKIITKVPDRVELTDVISKDLTPVWNHKFSCPGKPYKVILSLMDKNYGAKALACRATGMMGGNWLGSAMNAASKGMTQRDNGPVNDLENGQDENGLEMGIESFYNEGGDEYIGIKVQALERFWNKLADQDTDAGNSFHEAHFEYTLTNSLPDDDGEDNDPKSRKVVAINHQRIRCEIDIMNAAKLVKSHSLSFTKLAVMVGVGKHVYSEDTTHIVRHMEQIKSEQLEWFKLLQYGDAGNFYYKTNWPELLDVKGSNCKLDQGGLLNGTYRWCGTQKPQGDCGPEYPKYRHMKQNGFIDMKFQHHDHSRVWIIRNSEQVAVYKAKSEDCHYERAPPKEGWTVAAEPTPFDEGTSINTVTIMHSDGWTEKGPTSIVQLEKLFHIGKINLETMVREAKPNTPLEPMRKAKHPGMVELRSRLEENSGPIKKKDDNLLHNAISHIPTISNIFKRFDLSNMGFVANEDLKGVFCEMKVTNKEMVEGIQFFKMHGNMVDEAAFLAWSVKQDLKNQEIDKTTGEFETPIRSPMSPSIPDISRVVSIDQSIVAIPPGPQPPRLSHTPTPSAMINFDDRQPGIEGLPEPGMPDLVTPKRQTSRTKDILNVPRDKNSARNQRNRAGSSVVNA